VTRTLNTLQASLDLISGIPNETALPLAYWKNRTPPPDGEKLDPARDGCGLLWYAPLVDANAGCVRKYAEMVNALMPTFRMEPLITLSSVSERCFSSTVPILFDAQCADDRGRAKECHSRLLEHGKGLGFLPYRLDVDSMEWLMQQAPEHWALVAKLKSALDPAEIISPGRYAPHYAR
jgi:hypothetical protein